ncbi:NADH:flavin oxidoreductase [Shimazuella kribbensis]|uniref:oxidoreductase n=1 Tax=Shimazuella kribbensis TaxID=139808 RepID=UPI0003F80536|nr:NADH:flavin oxidoreductase [Shimazuella kribbensis]
MKINIHTPMKIGNLTLKNRLIMSPMQQYQGTIQAFATDHHIQFYSKRAGKVSLIIIESTAISPNGRLVPNDIGIFSNEHIEPLKKIVDAVHAKQTPIFIQLSHGGRKSAPEVTKHLIAPSPIAYDENYGIPNEMNHTDIKNIIEDYRLAAKRSLAAGFDGIELHLAHGFLLHEFLSPLSNKRTDPYGGSIQNRVRLIQEILEAIRSVTGNQYPIIVRVSASDFDQDGLTPVEVANALTYIESLIDAIDVSSGGLLPVQPLAAPKGYQVPYASIIKQFVQIPVIAVGKIHTKAFSNSILADRLADFIAVGSPLLDDPRFVDKMIDEN